MIDSFLPLTAVFRDGALAQLKLKRDFLNKDQQKHEEWFPLYMAKKQKESVWSLLFFFELNVLMPF